jgi:uncharacterized integral membrane protein (TIGR00698 family)
MAFVFLNWVIKNIAGVALCAFLATLAVISAKHLPALMAVPFSMPVMMLCLFFGMAASRLNTVPLIKTGIDTTSRTLLRLGIVLVGARIAFHDFSTLGLPIILAIMGSIALVITLGLLGARLLKIDRDLGFLIGGATAICGASAAMALSALLPSNKHTDAKTGQAIIVVSAIGTVAMISYPFLLTYAFPNLSQTDMGLIIGGTIHDVGQVVGAGYTLSLEAGDSAVLVKLIRVAMLAPVLMICSLIIGLRAQSSDQKPTLKTVFPLFLIGFAVMATLNSVGVLPEILQSWAVVSSGFLLKMALVAIGLKTSFSGLKTIGWRPIMLVFLLTIVLLAFYVSFLGSGLT